MKEYDVVNQVEINGKSICMESLTVEQRKQMVQKMAGPDHAACWVHKKDRLRAALVDKLGKER